MTPKPNDKTRLDFLGQFSWGMTYDLETKVWKVAIGKGVAIGKTPRKAIDEAMKWSQKAD